MELNSINTLKINNKEDIKVFIQNLGISLVILFVLIEFLKRVTNNFVIILKNYTDENRLIYGSENISKTDNYNYTTNNDFENKNTKILKSIRHIKINRDNNFDNLLKYKKKYNLDTEIYGNIDRKVLSKTNDNYEYKNSLNIIDFLLDVFKPTKT
jgi:hypothetical protein|tara:strand:- start:424 stop:888 length:465 start_codon:yes stop_codon:yes gene_type:complete